ncbi:hypothetical protein AgCh_009035 [Apium graveolens]
MDLWKEKHNAELETRPGDQEERSGESRGSVFDRIAKNLKKPLEDVRDEIKRAALRERIRKEEEAKAKETIEKRIREEEAKLKRKAHRIHVSSDSEPEKESKQEQMAWALRDLKRKVEGDMEVGAAATPFTKKLESTPRESGLKHFNLDSFDGLADPEEHLNYFEQISNIYDYSDLTRCRFFASTLKGGAQKWFSQIPSRSVDSWNDFGEIFLKRFRANRMNELQMYHLETFQQRSKESLPEFIKRFQEAVNQLFNLEEKEAVNIFRRNLHPISCEGYVKDLIYREMHDDDESPERRSSSRRDKRYKLDKQANYIQQSRGTPPRESYAEPRKNERKPKAKREPKPEPEWTPLNRPRADILREVKEYNMDESGLTPREDEEEEDEEGDNEGDQEEKDEGLEKMSLMALLVETDREMGVKSAYVMAEVEEEEVEEEHEDGNDESGEYNNCCVCMSKDYNYVKTISLLSPFNESFYFLEVGCWLLKPVLQPSKLDPLSIKLQEGAYGKPLVPRKCGYGRCGPTGKMS